MESKILQSISYFDVFNHPLNKDEISNLCGTQTDSISFRNAISALENSKICYEHNGFYSLQQDVKKLVKDREFKEKNAESYFKKLPFFIKLLRVFPFVRGVAISGSLSKNVMHEDGDIDYFIISAAGRMWICRTLLVLFKKTVLLNSKKYFCVNYFVDENNLEIIDKNIFTAVEINYLLAVYNHQLIDKMKAKNEWTKSFFPNFSHPIKLKDYKRRSYFQRLFELLFVGKTGDKLDLYLMKKTYARWSAKFKHFNASTMELTMRSNRGVSKHHPKNFQTKVLSEFEERISKLKLDL